MSNMGDGTQELMMDQYEAIVSAIKQGDGHAQSEMENTKLAGQVLLMSIRRGNPEITKMLLGDEHIQSALKENAELAGEVLLISVRLGNTEITKLLLDDEHTQKALKDTELSGMLLSEIFKSGNIVLLQIFLKNEHIQEKLKDPKTARNTLGNAMEFWSTPIIAKLLDNSSIQKELENFDSSVFLFHGAIRNGDIEIVNRTLGLENIKNIFNGNSDANKSYREFLFISAINASNVHVMEMLLKIPIVAELFTNNENKDFIRESLIAAITNPDSNAMMALLDFEGIKNMLGDRVPNVTDIIENRIQQDVAHILLEDPETLQNALELKLAIPEDYITEFVDVKLYDLGENNLISPEQIDLYFVILLFSISSSNPEYLGGYHDYNYNENIETLLQNPQIQHKINTDNDTQVQILLATMKAGNHEVLTVLASIIPNYNELIVHNTALAEALHHMYAGNMADIAGNTESAMLGLSPFQEQTVAATSETYEDKIEEAGGQDGVIEDLKIYLKTHLKQSPIIMDGVLLPIEWNDFQKLLQEYKNKFNPEEYAIFETKALEAYYKDPFHSALRYLSIPNKWIDIKAPFIGRTGEEENADGYAKFEDYIPLIALFWTAVKDAESKPTENCSLENRMILFIEGLAGINRAHNWDQYRPIENQDPNAPQTTEQYDDLGPDAPSCDQGVRSRLFQAVQYHELFKQMPERIQYEARDYEREHFRKVLESLDIATIIQINTDIEKIAYSGDTELVSPELEKFNINDDDINAFIKHLLSI